MPNLFGIVSFTETAPVTDITAMLTDLVSKVDFTQFITVFTLIVGLTIAPAVSMAVIRKGRDWLMSAIHSI